MSVYLYVANRVDFYFFQLKLQSHAVLLKYNILYTPLLSHAAQDLRKEEKVQTEKQKYARLSIEGWTYRYNME